MRQDYDLLEFPCAPCPGRLRLHLFGKSFDIEPVSARLRVLRHRHYPLVGPDEIAAFAAFASQAGVCVITGAPATVHPYRLLTCDEGMCGRFALQVSPQVRGNRHLYPCVYSFVPALVAVPAGVDAAALSRPGEALLYPLPRDVLLDGSDVLDALRLAALEQERAGGPA